MKKKYYVNTRAQDNGDHEVHDETCYRLPEVANRKYLGDYYSCEPAVAEAKKSYVKADGCYYCSNSCHNR
ncbi:MAG TPA: hypothetical protein VKB19_07765 [Pedobacter sp.]|nr:hypothetical protein [Pedobacter sp.]